jgi:hypothetical protein
MSACITTTCAFTRPLIINKPNEDLIISGKIRSNSPITIKVRNLIILGDVITSSTLTIFASEEVLNFGNVSAEKIVGKKFIEVLDERVIEKLNSLSITIMQHNPLRFDYQPIKG